MTSSGSVFKGPVFEGPVVVIATDEQDVQPVDLDRWSRLARQSLEAQGAGAGELNLLFVDRDEMTQLNAEHMGQDGCTDVLSFPLDAGDESFPDLDETNLEGDPLLGERLLGGRLLGDIVICPDYAAEQAPHHAGTYNDELALLVVHGVLHIMGMDHAESEETAVMQAAESELLARFYQ